jgi:hypothetical protein
MKIIYTNIFVRPRVSTLKTIIFTLQLVQQGDHLQLYELTKGSKPIRIKEDKPQ